MRTIGFSRPGGERELIFDVGQMPVNLPKIPDWGQVTAVVDGDGVAIEGQLPEAPKEAKPVRITHLNPGNPSHSLLDITTIKDDDWSTRGWIFLRLLA